MKVIILLLPVGSFCCINVAYSADRHSHSGVEATSDKQYLTDAITVPNCGTFQIPELYFYLSFRNLKLPRAENVCRIVELHLETPVS
jgi:hypothetical protein